MAKTDKPHATVEFIGRNRWRARAPGGFEEIHEDLSMARRRAKAALKREFGRDADYEIELLLPEPLVARLERNRQLRERLQVARLELREDTVEVVETVRGELGGSYNDAAELLGVTAPVLFRHMRNTGRA